MQHTVNMKATLERWYLTGFQCLQVTCVFCQLFSAFTAPALSPRLQVASQRVHSALQECLAHGSYRPSQKHYGAQVCSCHTQSYRWLQVEHLACDDAMLEGVWKVVCKAVAHCWGLCAGQMGAVQSSPFVMTATSPRSGAMGVMGSGVSATASMYASAPPALPRSLSSGRSMESILSGQELLSPQKPGGQPSRHVL